MSEQQQQQPSVSSLRVDKPGKAKFAPVIAGDRKKAQQPTAAPIAIAVPVPTAAKAEGVVERLLEPSLRAEQDEMLAASISRLEKQVLEGRRAEAKGATTIQAVHARRERAAATAMPKAKATTTEGEEVPSMPVVAEARKLFYYLKDRKEGIPMQNTTATRPNASAMASGKSTPAPSAVPSRSVSTVIAPQVRIVGGEIVVDEETTVMKTEEAGTDYALMDIVHDTGRHLTSHAFVKHSGSNRWTAEETKQFYDAVSMCGTDFSLISMLFPHKTREQIKGKYRIEERNNPKKMEVFMRRRLKFDTNWMKRAQQAKEEGGEAEATPAPPETKRGRPKQEFEGSPVPIPSIMSSPSRRASLSSPASPRVRKAMAPMVADEEDDAPLQQPPTPVTPKRPTTLATSSPLKVSRTASPRPGKRPLDTLSQKEVISSPRKSPRHKK